ncbi:MAG: hypothetical protein KDI90_11515 [Alphaproteobacteria bacterium]|nr:hypothetical protein [Alphaproteobacteria bacterium]MCB9974443.1 hypothetical protein [Rhodospirillales bacterium]
MTFDIEQQLRNDLQKLSGLCCWDLQNLEHSWISFNFGAPRLEIREPKDAEFLANVKSERSKQRFSLRQVRVRGDFWIWIDCCYWEILFRGENIANSRSDRPVIRKALNVVDGQIIKRIEIFPDLVQTKMFFDLGGEIHMRNEGESDDQPLWHIFNDTEGFIYSLRDNGSLEYGDSTYEIENIVIDL